jgi:hypothetical protein
VDTAAAVLHAVADRLLVNIEPNVIHTLHGGASFGVSESAWPLSSAFVHQALLHRLIHSNIWGAGTTTGVVLLMAATGTSSVSNHSGLCFLAGGFTLDELPEGAFGFSVIAVFAFLAAFLHFGENPVGRSTTSGALTGLELAG